MTNSKENNIKKVLIMGLDNSGKTSIVLCLKGVKNLLSFYSLNPTKGIMINKFETLGSEFNIWDFGGQEQYRGDYLKNFEDHLIGSNKIIFVIDVQDVDRYEIALSFLKDIVESIKNGQIQIEFTIFLHKYDPDLKLIKKELDDNLIQDLVSKIRDTFPYDFPFSIHTTSIYTVFQKSSLD